jgi:hypothetical protein
MKESLTPCRRVLQHHRRHWTDRAFVEVDAGNRLLDLERSRLARLGVDPIPVVQAKCDVAIFLHFEHHHVVERVNGPGSDENGIARLRREACQEFLQRMAREGPLEIVSSGAWLQAGVDAAGRPSCQRVRQRILAGSLVGCYNTNRSGAVTDGFNFKDVAPMLPADLDRLTPFQRLIVERSLVLAIELEKTADSAPSGQVIDRCESFLLNDGRDFLRTLLESTIQTQADILEKKVDRPESASAGRRGGTRGDRPRQ